MPIAVGRGWRRTLGSVLGALAVLLGLQLALAPAASAHAALVSITPPLGATVGTPPAYIVLRFSEHVQPVRGSTSVIDPAGNRVDTGRPDHIDGDPTSVGIPLERNLGRGTYLVTWRVISADSHPVGGTSTFSVYSPSTVASAPGNQAGTTGLLLGLARGAGFGAALVLIGGLAFALRLWPRGLRLPRFRRLLIAAWAIAAVATVGALLMQGAYGAGLPAVRAFDPSVIAPVLHTDYGVGILLRLAVLALGLPVLLARPGKRPSDLQVAGALTLAVPLAVSFGLEGHPSASSPVAAWMAVDALHVLATGVWLGGLVVLVTVLLPQATDAVLARVLPRWSRTAVGAVVVLVVTGSLATWHQVGFSASALFGTAYGRLLVVKVALVALMLLLGGLARTAIQRRLGLRTVVAAHQDVTPEVPATAPSDEDRTAQTGLLRQRLRRSVLVETGLAAVVVTVTAVLVISTPAKTAAAPSYHHIGPFAGRTVQVDLEPAKRGVNQLHVYLTDGHGIPRDVPQVQAQLVHGGNTYSSDMRHKDPGHFEDLQVVLPKSGRWQLEVRIRTSDFDEEVLDQNVTVH